MIVTCPSCSARYKINESKIAGRGAKITCPRCAHRFVVYRDEEEEAAVTGGGRPKRKVPDNLPQLDFSSLGITWRVRKGIGVTYDFYDLATLQDFLRDGQVDKWDAISFDNREWTAIETIDELESFFYDVWQRAMRGEVSISASDEDAAGADDEEDDSDAPTTIVGRGSSLASEIRQAITDAATPPPAARRGAMPQAHVEDEGELADDLAGTYGEPETDQDDGPDPIPVRRMPTAEREVERGAPAGVGVSASRMATPAMPSGRAEAVGRAESEEPAPLSVTNTRTPPPAPAASKPAPQAAAPAPSLGRAPAPPAQRSSAPLVIGLLLILVLAAVAVGLWASGMLGGGGADAAEESSRAVFETTDVPIGSV